MTCRCPYWVTERIGGCSLICPEDIESLEEAGVSAIVGLVEEDEYYECWDEGVEGLLEALYSRGIEFYYIPTPDFAAPDVEEACRVFRRVEEVEKRGGRIVFHCYAGLGRTGTMIAAYLVAVYGMGLEKALEAVKKACPYAGPQSYAQEFFLEVVASQANSMC